MGTRSLNLPMPISLSESFLHLCLRLFYSLNLCASLVFEKYSIHKLSEPNHNKLSHNSIFHSTVSVNRFITRYEMSDSKRLGEVRLCIGSTVMSRLAAVGKLSKTDAERE